MVNVLCYHDAVVSQGCCRNEDVGIANELSPLVEERLNVSGTDNDVIRQGKHMTVLTALLEAGNLAVGASGLQASQDLIPRHDRKGEATKGCQILARVV